MRCPICEREFDPSQSTAKPFCCERCRLIDLGRWLGEGYGVPAERPVDMSEDGDEQGA
jgi:uncharacterized protein